jgi:transcriptional regulator with XRE-family HTH domain
MPHRTESENSNPPETVDSSALPGLYTPPEPPPPNLQVDGEAAENVIAEKRIGERIKHLRLKKSMGLVELGQHTGLSASFLSQLETGRVVPTLRNLARIAMVFSKDLSYFFEPEPQTLFRVHRRKDRVRLPQSGVEDPSYYFESLGYMVPDRQLDPYYAEFLPQKFLLLLTGRLDLQHGETTHHLEAGDSAYFDADTIHSYICVGDQAASAVIVTLQQPLAAQYIGGPRTGVGGIPPNRVRPMSSTLLRPRPTGTEGIPGPKIDPTLKKTTVL